MRQALVRRSTGVCGRSHVKSLRSLVQCSFRAAVTRSANQEQLIASLPWWQHRQQHQLPVLGRSLYRQETRPILTRSYSTDVVAAASAGLGDKVVAFLSALQAQLSTFPWYALLRCEAVTVQTELPGCVLNKPPAC